MPKFGFKPTKVPAVVGTPNADMDRLSFYTAEIPASVVATFTVDRAIDTEGGFQRPLDTGRARKIGMLMGGDAKKDIDPEPHVHGGLLAYATDEDVSYAPSTGVLTIRKPLHLLDGQTRAGGALWAVENGKAHDYTETVKIVVGAEREELVRWYLISNMTSRKVQPANVLVNVATMRGTQQGRKSWIARTMMTLATEAPFTLQRDSQFVRLVGFQRSDGGRISPYTLYKAINFLLPEELNKEGRESEKKALAYAREAFKLYADLYSDVWAKTDEDGKLIHHDCYEFTLMAAFARFYKAVHATVEHKEAIEAVKGAWIKCGFVNGLPEESGSGERAALALAAYAAGEANVGPLKVSV